VGVGDFQKTCRGNILTGDIFDLLLHGNFIQTCTLVIRKSLISQFLSTAISANNYLVGDWPLCLYVAALSKFGYLDETLAVYRKTEGSMTNLGALKDLERVEDSRRMINDFCQAFDKDDSLRQSALASTYRVQRRMAYLAADRRRLAEAIDWLRQHPQYDVAAEYGALHGMVAKFPFMHRLLAPVLRGKRNRHLERMYKASWR
jgi:hypothetical protein